MPQAFNEYNFFIRILWKSFHVSDKNKKIIRYTIKKTSACPNYHLQPTQWFHGLTTKNTSIVFVVVLIPFLGYFGAYFVIPLLLGLSGALQGL